MLRSFLKISWIALFLSLGTLACTEDSGSPSSTRKRPLQNPGKPGSPASPTPAAYSAALGLRNLGNTCFANSVFNLLWADGRFGNSKDNERIIYNQASKQTANFQRLLFQFIEALEKSSTDLASGLSPNMFGFSSLQVKLYNFINWTRPFNGVNLPSSQEAADEFLYYLDDALKLSENYGGLQISSLLRFQNHPHFPNPPLHEIGQNLSITLDVVGPEMQSAIEHHLSNKPVSDPIEREDTHLKEAASQETFFTLSDTEAPPTHIYIHLKRLPVRLDGSLEKLQRPVSADKKLILDFYDKDLNHPRVLKQNTYSLAAVSIHSGTAFGGHYYAYVRHKTGEWFEHNDSKVTPIDDKTHMWDDISRNGYLFLYKE